MRWILRVRQVCDCKLHIHAFTHQRAERVPGQNATETTAKRNIEGGIQKWRMVRK